MDVLDDVSTKSFFVNYVNQTNMVGDINGNAVLVLIVQTLLCMPMFGQITAVDWDNEGVHLRAQGKYNEAIQAFDKAIEIDLQDADAWYEKSYALNKLGRTTEANAAYAKANELEFSDSTSRPATISWITPGTINDSNDSMKNELMESFYSDTVERYT